MPRSAEGGVSDDLVLDLLERARYFAGITGIGVPREVMANPPREAAPQALGVVAVARGGLDSSRLAPETLAAVICAPLNR